MTKQGFGEGGEATRINSVAALRCLNSNLTPTLQVIWRCMNEWECLCDCGNVIVHYFIL